MELLKKTSPFILTILIGLIFFSTFSSYSITDAENMLNLSVSIYELGDLSSAIKVNLDTGERVYVFSKYGLGLPVFLLPFLAINDILHSVFSGVNSNTILSLPNLIISALLAEALYLIITTLGYSHRKGLSLSIAAIFCTFIYPYLNVIFTEPLQALTLTCTFLFILKAIETDEKKGSYILLAIAGAFFGYGVLTKTALVIFIPLFYAYQVLGIKRRNNTLGKKKLPMVASIASFTSTLALFALIIAALNHHRFGSVFALGYGEETMMFVNPLFQGISDLLINPNKGLLLFAPLMILLPYAVWRFSKVFALESIIIAMLFIVNFIIYAKWWAWEGAASWGPRFLLPLVPLAIIPLAELTKKRAGIIIIAILAIGGFLVNLLGVVVNPVAFDNLVLNSTIGMEIETTRPKTDYIDIGAGLQVPPYVVSSEIAEFSAPLGHLWLMRTRHEGLLNGYGFTEKNQRFKNPPWKENFPNLLIPDIKDFPIEMGLRFKCPPPLILAAFACPDKKPTTPIYYNALMNQVSKAEMMGLKVKAAKIRKKAGGEFYEMQKRLEQMRYPRQ
ncbi:MAG: glycosyltransferase family 39 protein [Thermodesulfobacteriota bacterium]